MNLKFNKKLFIIFGIIALLVLSVLAITVYISNNRITSIPAPVIKNLPSTLGGRVVLQGVGYPESKVLIFYNDSLIDQTTVDYSGNFSKNIIVTNEGEATFKVKLMYKDIESAFSNSIISLIDLTPPDPTTFKMSSTIPSQQNQNTVTLNGTISAGDKLLINGKDYPVEENGSFSIIYTLTEGNNTLGFQMVDSYGNKTSELLRSEIYVDTIKPEISSSLFGDCDTKTAPTKEIVQIRIGEWSGYLDSTNSVAIVGCIGGNVKSITVDGKKINWDENNEIYQRVNLYIRGGLNKYKTVVTDKAGNIATGYVETTAVKDKDSIDVNLNY